MKISLFRLATVIGIMAATLVPMTVAHEISHQFGGIVSGENWGRIEVHTFGLGGRASCRDGPCSWLFAAGPSLFVYLPAVMMLLVALYRRWHPLITLVILMPAWVGGSDALLNPWTGSPTSGDFIALSARIPLAVIQATAAAVYLLCLCAFYQVLWWCFPLNAGGGRDFSLVRH